MTDTPAATVPANSVSTDNAPVADVPAASGDGGVALHRHPGPFYALSAGIPWTLWGVAAVLSRSTAVLSESRLWVIAGVAIAGLCAPAAVAAFFIVRQPALRTDTLARLRPAHGVRPWLLALAVGLLPCTLLLAMALSLLLGYPVSQFHWKATAAATIGPLPGWFVIGLAPFVEELAWHTYGTDTLASRWSVWRTTIVFGVFWALWHVPLAAIRGSYQAEVTDVGVLASVNFLLSIFPFLIIMNWLYYRSRRNVWIAVVVHLSANFGNELLRSHPDTKVIQTVLLLIPCAWILWHDRTLFFAKPEPEPA